MLNYSQIPSKYQPREGSQPVIQNIRIRARSHILSRLIVKMQNEHGALNIRSRVILSVTLHGSPYTKDEQKFNDFKTPKILHFINVILQNHFLYPPSKTNVVCPCQNCSGSLEKFCKKTGEKPREKDQFGDTEQTPSLVTGEFYLAPAHFREWGGAQSIIQYKVNICQASHRQARLIFFITYSGVCLPLKHQRSVFVYSHVSFIVSSGVFSAFSFSLICLRLSSLTISRMKNALS